ncbi:MAG: cache domain-containing protein, partial [Myxococcota bacterium]
MRIGLRAQIFLFVFVAGLIPVSVLGWIELQALELALREQIERETQVAAEAAGQQIQILVAEKVRLMQLLADEVEQSTSRSQLRQSLERAVARTPGMVAIIVTNADGRVVTASRERTSDDRPVSELDYSDRDYFKALQKGAQTAVTGVLFSKTTGRRSVAIAAARRGPNGEFRGAVACAMAVGIIDEAVEALAETVPRLSIDIVDDARRWLASSRDVALA